MFALSPPESVWSPGVRPSAGRLEPGELSALRPALRGMIARLLSLGVEHPDVEDATQETLRRILEGSSSLTPGSPLRPWAFGVARHVALDALRTRRRTASRQQPDDGELLALPDEAPSPETSALARQRSVAAQQALEQLPEGMRRALLLFHGEGLSYQQIAERLDLPVGTVATWVTRGRKILATSCQERKPFLCIGNF